MFNPKLLECAEYAVKLAFVPPGSGMPPPQDPAAMGAAPGLPPSAAAPPPDPAMAAGGAPAPPPMDPAMAGGAPPPADPAAAAGGAAPPPSPSPGGMDPEMIRMIIREEMAQGGAGAQKPKVPKITPEQMHQETVRTRKMLTHLFGVMNIGLPPDILDDPAPQGQEGGGGSSGGSSDSKPSGGSSSGTAKSAIAPPGPIDALAPAFPMGKTGSSSGVFQNAEALLAILNAGE